LALPGLRRCSRGRTPAKRQEKDPRSRACCRPRRRGRRPNPRSRPASRTRRAAPPHRARAAHERQTPRDRRRASRTPWLARSNRAERRHSRPGLHARPLRNRRHGRAGDVRSRGHRSGREARTLGGLSHHRSPWIRADRTPRRRRAWLQGGVGAHRARQAERSRRSRRGDAARRRRGTHGTSAAELAPRRADRPESATTFAVPARSAGASHLGLQRRSLRRLRRLLQCSGDGQRRSPLAVSARGAGYRVGLGASALVAEEWDVGLGDAGTCRLRHGGRSLGAPARSQPPAARSFDGIRIRRHRRAQRAWPRHDGAGARRRDERGGGRADALGGASEPSSAA